MMIQMQFIIVALIMFASVIFLLRKLVFKPKKTKHDCSSGCGKCGGCG